MLSWNRSGMKRQNPGLRAWVKASMRTRPGSKKPSLPLQSSRRTPVLANFQDAKKAFYKDARRALDQSRINRGFYPGNKAKGKGSEKGRGDGKTTEFKGRCMRCGKVGHKAMHCPQGGPGRSSQPGKGAGTGFVYTNWATEQIVDEPDLDTTEESEELIFSVQKNDGMRAIIDCGASESIVGALTLQEVCSELDDLGFDSNQEVRLDTKFRKSFVFGNNQSSLALGHAEVNTGINGVEEKIGMHVVEGPTPMLLSGR